MSAAQPSPCGMRKSGGVTTIEAGAGPATAGATTTCVYPAGAGACAAPSATKLLTGLGVRSFTAPTSSTPVTIKITMELTAAAATTLAGLQLLPCMAFATTAVSGTVWAAQISYPGAMVLL